MSSAPRRLAVTQVSPPSSLQRNTPQTGVRLSPARLTSTDSKITMRPSPEIGRFRHSPVPGVPSARTSRIRDMFVAASRSATSLGCPWFESRPGYSTRAPSSDMSGQCPSFQGWCPRPPPASTRSSAAVQRSRRRIAHSSAGAPVKAGSRDPKATWCPSPAKRSAPFQPGASRRPLCARLTRRIVPGRPPRRRRRCVRLVPHKKWRPEALSSLPPSAPISSGVGRPAPARARALPLQRSRPHL